MRSNFVLFAALACAALAAAPVPPARAKAARAASAPRSARDLAVQPMPCGPATAPAELLRRVQAAYAKRSLSARFEQLYVDVVSGPRPSEQGKLCLDASGRMRFDYEVPEKKWFVFDGRQAWFVEPAAKQVTMLDHFGSSEAATALSLLAGGGNVLSLAQFATDGAAPDARLAPERSAVLQFVPRANAGSFAKLGVAVQPQTCQIERVVLQDALGNKTVYQLHERTLGAACPAAQFGKDWPSQYDVLHADAPSQKK